MTFPDDHPLCGQSGEVFGFAIRHATGLVLFDTGIGSGNDGLDRYYGVVHHSLEAALARHEHRLDDVTAIVSSHLHFDHCGNNHLFPGVPIHVQRAEHDAARERGYTIPDWIDFEGAVYVPADGESHIARGLRIIPTPGHTAGHQSLVVETSDGRVVCAGQAVYSRADFDHIRTTGTIPDDEQPVDADVYLASAQRIIDLDAHRIWFSHDREVWDRA